MARPSRAGSLIPASSLGFPHAKSARQAATASELAAMGRRGSIGERILVAELAGTGGVHARRRPEARGLQGLVSGHGGPRQGLVGRLLEDHAQALQRDLAVAPDPASG